MRRLTGGLLLLITGWSLGWYSHHYWGAEPDAAPDSVDTVNALTADVVPPAPEPRPSRRAPVGDLAQLLDRGTFDTAFEHYAVLQQQADAPAVQRARERILSHAEKLINGQRYRPAIKLLQLYLQYEYRDAEARLLLAQAFYHDGELRDAIDALYEARGHAYRPAMLERLTRRLRAVTAEHIKVLARNSDHTGLLQLYQHLTQLEPAYAPYFIGLANTQLALNDKDAARRSLLLVAQDPDVGAGARTLLAQLRDTEAGIEEDTQTPTENDGTGVPLVRRGNHFLVDARLNNTHDVRLLIDTGASVTILSPAALDRSGIRYTDTGRTSVFNTANGQVRAPIYRLDVLVLGDWQVSRLEFGVLELAGSSAFDGLLGMNFLEHFQFFIDQNEALLRLQLKESG
jgi:clan AA aspartic protease (TIGR02281 family)